jgi:hypothetical protein
VIAGENVGTTRRIGLIVPDISTNEGDGTLSSLISVCSSWRRMVRLSGVRLISNVPIVRNDTEMRIPEASLKSTNIKGY